MTEQYWPIKEFSKLTGVSVRTLHFYDNNGILLPHHKNAAGYRFYSEEQLLSLQKINILKYVGFNLQQIKTILSHADFDWQNSFRLQATILEENLAQMQKGITLINDSLIKYSDNGTLNWQVVAKILEVLKMTQNGIYQDWVKRNFSDNEIALFVEINPIHKQQSNDELWKNLFTQARALKELEVSHPEVQKLAQKFMDSANSQYTTHVDLRNKMWELMKNGDVPEGLIPGYSQEVVLFMNQAIAYLYLQKNI